MIDRRQIPSRIRWLLPALGFVLLFGHVCDARSYLEWLLPSHQDDHHHGSQQHSSADRHTPDVQIACDAVDAVSNTGCAPMDPRVDLATGVSAGDPDAARLVASPRPEVVTTLPTRPPLFLLHAALLI